MKKRYIINLNPDENPNPYLKIGLLCNPCEKYDPEIIIEKNLRAGCTLEQAKSLLGKLLSKEVVNLTLDGAKLGDRLEIIVDSNKKVLYKRKLSSQKSKTKQ